MPLAASHLVPKLRLGTPGSKLCFDLHLEAEAELPIGGSQAELGNQVSLGTR